MPAGAESKATVAGGLHIIGGEFFSLKDTRTWIEVDLVPPQSGSKLRGPKQPMAMLLFSENTPIRISPISGAMAG